MELSLPIVVALVVGALGIGFVAARFAGGSGGADAAPKTAAAAPTTAPVQPAAAEPAKAEPVPESTEQTGQVDELAEPTEVLGANEKIEPPPVEPNSDFDDDFDEDEGDMSTVIGFDHFDEGTDMGGLLDTLRKEAAEAKQTKKADRKAAKEAGLDEDPA